jgi:tRNA dimethylallyltransferase
MEFDLDQILAAEAVLIAGPTASGKSALALDLADRLARAGRVPVIVNADSMQVYSGLRVLSARPDDADMARCEHSLYGHIDPSLAFSTGQWLAEAEQVLAELRGAEKFPVFAGGTGLYFKALTEGFAPIPDIPDDIRRQWRDRLSETGAEALHGELAARDPEAADAIMPADAQRIVRALEVLEATGQSIRVWQSGRNAEPALPCERTARFVVQPDRALLYARIEQRFDTMIEAGALDEVKALLDLGLDPELPAMKAIGVRELGRLLAGQMTQEAAIEQAKTRTRQYAKRQMTWMRNQMGDWTWIEP